MRPPRTLRKFRFADTFEIVVVVVIVKHGS
jgi:hypothetical protein